MVKAKKSSSKQSKTSTTSRASARVAVSQPARRQTRLAHDPSQKVILAVLILSCLAVIAAVVAALVCNTEFEVKSRLSSLADTYYEEYFYPNAFSGTGEIAEALAKYTETGVTAVNLRQMLLHTPGITSGQIDFLRKYCNEDTTTATFYPEAPFDAKSVRVQYSYSCNF